MTETFSPVAPFLLQLRLAMTFALPSTRNDGNLFPGGAVIARRSRSKKIKAARKRPLFR
jgi:hypothetical protein